MVHPTPNPVHKHHNQVIHPINAMAVFSSAIVKISRNLLWLYRDRVWVSWQWKFKVFANPTVFELMLTETCVCYQHQCRGITEQLHNIDSVVNIFYMYKLFNKLHYKLDVLGHEDDRLAMNNSGMMCCVPSVCFCLVLLNFVVYPRHILLVI